MINRLVIKEANEELKIQAFKNVFDVWPHAPDLQAHTRLRMGSLHHQRARWFVGLMNDHVVTSLGVFPLEFRLHQAALDGFGIAAVHTPTAYRNQGYAGAMLSHVITQMTDEGRRLSLLFSDIAPTYYEKFGYQTIPARSIKTIDLSLPLLTKDTSEKVALHAVDPQKQLDVLIEIHTEHLKKFDLVITRSISYWHWLLAKQKDWYYLFIDQQLQPLGYLALARKDTRLILQEVILKSSASALSFESIITALAQWAEVFLPKIRTIHGWCPTGIDIPASVSLERRDQAVPMLAGFDSLSSVMFPSLSTCLLQTDSF